MNSVFKEVIFETWNTSKSADEVLYDYDKTVGTCGKWMRFVYIFLCMLGFYLLFAPIINVLSWIPFVGWLLSAMAKAVAALTAFVFGGTLAVTTLAIAWIRFRPCLGITLFVCATIGLALLFALPFIFWEKK